MAASLVLALVPYIAWGSFIIALFALMLLALPNGADFPLPVEAVNTIRTAYDYMYAFNTIIPFDTFIHVVYYGFYMLIFSRIIIPALIWMFKSLSGGGQ